MQLVIAEITTSPWVSSWSMPATRTLVVGLGALGQHRGKRLLERRLGLAERHPVLRPLRPGEARLDAREVELERVAEQRIGRSALAPHALRLGVGLDQGDPLGRAAGQAQIVEGQPIDREDAAGGTVFGRHVAQRRAISERQPVETVAEILDELADHALPAQHLGHGQDEIGRGGAFGQLTGELEADHLGNDHRDRLTEHRRLGLDAAHAPAEHAEAIDHRGVAVGADQGVGEGELAVALAHRPDHLRQIFQIDLVTDAGARRHDPEVVEGARPPAEESVALGVAFILALDVDLEGARIAERVDLNRMVDHQIDRRERVDPLGVAAEVEHRLAHRREIDHRRHTGEVLHQHPRRPIGDFLVRAARLEPGDQGLEVLGRDAPAVLMAEQILEQHLQ